MSEELEAFHALLIQFIKHAEHLPDDPTIFEWLGFSHAWPSDASPGGWPSSAEHLRFINAAQSTPIEFDSGFFASAHDYAKSYHTRVTATMDVALSHIAEYVSRLASESPAAFNVADESYPADKFSAVIEIAQVSAGLLPVPHWMAFQEAASWREFAQKVAQNDELWLLLQTGNHYDLFEIFGRPDPRTQAHLKIEFARLGKDGDEIRSPSATQDAQPDGPTDDGRFFHNGKPIKVNPQQYRILNALWPDKRLAEQSLIDAVWDPNRPPTAEAVRIAINRTNNVLERLQGAGQIHQRGGYIELS